MGPVADAQSAVKRILGLDPGLNHLGWAVIETEGPATRAVAFGVFDVPRGELPERLSSISKHLTACIGEYRPDCAAIERLEELHQVLKIYGIDKYVSVELGIVSNYQYYTGIIFAGYTFGSGEPIVKGGRYDELLTYFGKESASIGFAIVIDQLMAALSRQKIEIPVQYQNELIIYDSKMRSEAIKKAMELRTDGRNVELMARDISKTEEDYRTYAKQNHFVNVTFM